MVEAREQESKRERTSEREIRMERKRDTERESEREGGRERESVCVRERERDRAAHVLAESEEARSSPFEAPPLVLPLRFGVQGLGAWGLGLDRGLLLDREVLSNLDQVLGLDLFQS